MSGQRRTIDQAAVIAAYLAGDNTRVVAAQHGISQGRVKQILGENSIETRGRRDHWSDEECRAAVDAFVAGGGHSVHGYLAWSKTRDVPSYGTVRNHALQDYSIERFASVRSSWDPPSVHDVRPIDPPYFAAQRAVEWVFLNGTESVKALCDYHGCRVKCEVSLPARRRGTNAWSLSELDRIHPDLTCGASR